MTEEKTLTITLEAKDEANDKLIAAEVKKEYKKAFGVELQEGDTYTLQKRSVDARHKKIKIHLRYSITVGTEKSLESKDFLPKVSTLTLLNKGQNNKKVVIVGAGPAGLFCALELVKWGIKPTIIERGKAIHERKLDVARLCRTGIVNAESNYAFGAGGAGTFSDGKLFTRSNKHTDPAVVLKTLVDFGADSAILTQSNAHIGSDKLPNVINNIIQYLSNNGCKINFETKLIDFVVEGNKVKSAVTLNTNTKKTSSIPLDVLALATGHSASDVYRLLAKKREDLLEAKSLAFGVRVEHPRSLIDKIQFGKNPPLNTAAEYRLKTQVNERGVYTFCMCPGGFILPCYTEEESIVVNGMSASKRNSLWSNSAVVVETRIEDIPEEITKAAKQRGEDALAMLDYRQALEKKAFESVNARLKEFTADVDEEDISKTKATATFINTIVSAPAQTLCSFVQAKDAPLIQKTSYRPKVLPSRIDLWLDEHIAKRLQSAFLTFDKMMKGFLCQEALIIGVETRTSAPVRILRDKETLQSAIENLYPAGEGSGYAGGITTSAYDGVKVAMAIMDRQ